MASDGEPLATRPLRTFDWQRLVRRVRLVPTAKGLALVLATYADDDGGNAFPSQATLAAVMGISERQAGTHLRTLKALGLVVVVAHGARWNNQADTYQLTAPKDLEHLGDLLPVTAKDTAEQYRKQTSGSAGSKYRKRASGTRSADEARTGSTARKNRKSTTREPEADFLPPDHYQTRDQNIRGTSLSVVQDARARTTDEPTPTTPPALDYATASARLRAAEGDGPAADAANAYAAEHGIDVKEATIALARDLPPTPAEAAA